MAKQTDGRNGDDEDGFAERITTKGIERLLSVQRPVVIAHLRRIHAAHPDFTPQQVLRVVELRYLAAVTAGGAAVGASAVVPGIGTAASVALSGVETAGFLEATALFAQSVAEVHGFAVNDPERANALVMGLIVSTGGKDLISQVVRQASGQGPARGAFWGEIVARQLPKSLVGQVGERIRRTFLKRFVVKAGTGVLGRAVPFGIGAVVGGVGNNMLGRRVVAASRQAFGPTPETFTPALEREVAGKALPAADDADAAEESSVDER